MPVDKNVFNGYHIEVGKPNPCAYQKKGSTVLKSEYAQATSPSRSLRPQTSPSGLRLRAFAERPNPPNTDFRRFYERGDLPIQIDHCGVVNKLQWKIEIEKLDYHHYLPLFFSGLREEEEPYNFIATQGIKDMIGQTAASGKTLPVLPQLIIPIKEALNTRRRKVVEKTLKILQELAQCEDFIGQALVPYYRQILPIFQIFIRATESTGDGIIYGQKEERCLGDLVMKCLEVFECTGGEDAFINIKYLIPTYQSCMD